MANVVEFFGGTLASGSSATATREYTVFDADSFEAAEDALLAYAPTSFNGLPRAGTSVAPLGVGVWRGVATYSTISGGGATPDPEAASTFSFDTGGGTQHITVAKQRVSTYPAGVAHNGVLIGATPAGATGTDIIVPIYNWTQTKYFAAAAVNSTYRGRLFSLTGKTNSGSFQGMSAGEVLFLGASGQRTGTGDDDPWQLSFRFAGSPNRSGISIDDISGITVKGWEYLDVTSVQVLDEASGTMRSKAKAVHVLRVYDSGDFSQLGL